MSLQVLIAEDSSLFVEALTKTLDAEPGVNIAAIANNGVDAVEYCESHQPDIVLMDIHMPRLDGLSATEKIMARCPTPILVVTSDPHRGGVDQSFRALSAGALDLMAKPDRLPFSDDDRERLLRKLRLLSQIPVVRHVRARQRDREESNSKPQTAPHQTSHQPTGDQPTGDPMAVVGIVASTGGPQALANICTELPSDFPAALLVVQHITDGFSRHLARWLDKHSALDVLEAEDGAGVEPGQVLIAPTRRHLVVDQGLTLGVRDGPPIGGHRPSGDRLLMSMARHASPQAIGLILSGMGDDGAAGLTALSQSGCPTIAQNEATSVVYGMPRVASARGVVDHSLADTEIASALTHLVDQVSSSTSGESR